MIKSKACSRKVAHTSPAKARKAIRAQGKKSKTWIYQCDCCGLWHLTSYRQDNVA